MENFKKTTQMTKMRFIKNAKGEIVEITVDMQTGLTQMSIDENLSTFVWDLARDFDFKNFSEAWMFLKKYGFF